MRKSDLRNMALFLITPFPKKYHFEGVDNRRAAYQLLLVNVLGLVALIAGPSLWEQARLRIGTIKRNRQHRTAMNNSPTE